LREIAVIHFERNFFGGSQAGKESKLVVVALRFTPIVVNRRDERLGFLDRKWIDLGTILLLDLWLQPIE
jgi:hypothetical protein